MILQINKQIYGEEIINSTIKELSEIASIKISTKKNKYYFLEISKIKKEYQKDFIDEFFNYLLIKKIQENSKLL